MATSSHHFLERSRSYQRGLVQASPPLLQWCSLFLLLVVVVGCKSDQAAEAPESESRYQQLARRYVDVIITTARNKAFTFPEIPEDTEFLQGFPNAKKLKEEEQRKLEGLFGNQLANLTTRIQGRTTDLVQELDNRKRDWIQARADYYSKKIELAGLSSANSLVEIMKVVLKKENRYFWLFSLFAIGILMAIHWHYRRHEYRRMLMGSRARSMRLGRLLPYLFLVLLVLTLAVFFFAEPLEHKLIKFENPDATTFSDLEENVAELEGALVEVTRQPDRLNNQYAKNWLNVETAARENWTLATAIVDGSVNYNRVIIELKETNDQFQRQMKEFDDREDWQFKIRIGLAGLLSLFVFGSSYLLFRNIKHHKKKIEETCPKCLAENEWETIEGEEERYRCVSPDEEYGGICNFDLYGIYREKRKLSFPTLGVPQAGKTLWLCMLYDSLLGGKYKKDVMFDRVRGEQTDEIERIVREILDYRMAPEGTQPDPPPPLIFNFTDNDFWGKSNVLVNIFDYAGEITQNRPLEDPQRNRALKADGYFFFIDPTDGASEAEQKDALANFKEDLRVINKIKDGQTIRTPVAICVSKLDLLVNQKYAHPSGKGAVAKFLNDLVIDEISLDAIRKRSDLMANFSKTVWPSWNIEQTINQSFGGRFRFFPLTPVGRSNEGETDFKDMLFQPEAILEPLIWLLHMNGFKILS